MRTAIRGRTTDTASWWIVAAMAGACLCACRGLGFTLDLRTAVLPGIGVALLVGAAAAGRRLRRPGLATGAVAFLQMTLFTILGVVLSYALAARGGASWDARLAGADRWLGFDWPAVLRWLDGSPAALWIGGVAYHSLVVQMIICIVALSAGGRAEALRLAIVAAISSGFATILISGLVPADGNLFDPANYRILWPSVAWMERGLIAGLRDGSFRALDLGRLMGIVTFPSYHATMPVILVWAQRDVPRLRVAAAGWGVVTILATPVFGGHYAVDVLAGLALAIVAIAVAPMLAPRREPICDRKSACQGGAR